MRFLEEGIGLGSSWYGISGVEKTVLSDSWMIWISNTGPVATRCACVHAKSLSRVPLCATLRTVAWQAPLFMGFFSQEYWSGFPCPPPGDLPIQGSNPCLSQSPALAGTFFTTSAIWEDPLQPKVPSSASDLVLIWCLGKMCPIFSFGSLYSYQNTCSDWWLCQQRLWLR